MPHALTWNIGTIISSRSDSSSRNAPQTPKQCSQMDRWLYTTPLGSPVVPVV